MKKLLLLILICLAGSRVMAQHIYPIRADSVRIYSNCDTAELIIENRTKDTLGFLYNKGNGRTEFRKLQLQKIGNSSIAITGQDTLQLGTILKTAVDTIYQSNGMLYYRKTDGVLVSLPVSTTETLESVSNRGSSMTNTLVFNSAADNPSNGLAWFYQSDEWRVFVEAPTNTPSGNMIFQAGDDDSEGWIFRHSLFTDTSPIKQDVLSVGRDRFLYKGNTIYHSGNVATKGNSVALKTETDGVLGVENWIRTAHYKGLYTPDGAYLYRNSARSWALRSGDVDGNGNTAVWLELQTNDGVSRGRFYSDGAIGNLGIKNAEGNDWRMWLDVNSNMHVLGQVYATAFYQNSLRSLKRDIKPFEGHALKVLNAASVRTFIYKADTANIEHIGFIADEIPQEMAAPGREGVDQANTVALLVKALQEMNAKVEALQHTVETLKKKVAENEK